MRHLEDRFQELMALARQRGVELGDVPRLPEAVRALASALGLSEALAMDPEIPLEELLAASRGEGPRGLR